MGEDEQGNPHDGWATLTEHDLDDLDSFNYETRRGGSHFVFEPIDDRRLGPTKNHVTPDGITLDSIDRRAGSSYFIWWGEEIPVARDEFAPAPEWLLTEAPEPVAESAGYGGTVEEWLAKCNQGEPSEFILEWVDSIPKEDFGHHEMVQMQAALVGLGASGKPGVPWALERLRAEWLRGPYGTPEFARDWTLALRGAIEKYGNFEADVLADLIAPAKAESAEVRDYAEAAMSIGGTEFFAAWTTLPEVDTPESRQERVRRVLQLALDSGSVSRVEAVEIALNAAANKNEQREPILSREGVEALASDTFPGERLYAVEEGVSAPLEVAPTEHKRVRLLTLAEEQRLSGVTWWGDEFMDRMAEVNPVMSEQFYRLNRWIILSLIFSNKAAIIDENDTKMLLNFYAIILGPSGIGKSQSLNPVKGMMAAYFFMEDSPDIGGNATEAGLVRALIKRDGKTSFFHSDEADGVLMAWSDKLSAFAGMKQRMTDVYGGDVPPMQRSTAQDISGIHAKAFLCAHLTGIDERILDAIEPHDWESGFVNRFIWAKGHRKPRTREQRLRRISTTLSDGETRVQKWYNAWAARFRGISTSLFGTADDTPLVGMEVDRDVIEREADLWERFEAMAQNSAHPERLRPTFERLWSTVLKCAALVALSEERIRVNMDDYLIALEQAEEWTENVLEMVEATDESARSRQVNRLAVLIQRHGGAMSKAKIHSQKGYAGNSRDVNGLIDELVQQGRAEVLPVGKTGGLVRLIDEEGAAA